MSKIEWTGKTWNPVAGCSLASPGCAHCYAMRMAARLEAMGQAKYAGTTRRVNGLPVWTGRVNLDDAALAIPLGVRKPTTWFVNSMSDLFHEGVPFEFVVKVYAVCLLAQWHTFQILTKRPERAREFCRWLEIESGGDPYNHLVDVGRSMFDRSAILRACDRSPVFSTWPLPNLWLGVSVEDRKRMGERAPSLADCPGVVTFWSVEPLLEDLGQLPLAYGPKWVIVGGESGPGARPCNVEWVRSIVRQCRAAGVACFVKQLGARPYEEGDVLPMPGRIFGPPPDCSEPVYEKLWFDLDDPKGGDPAEWDADLRVREMPEGRVTP